MAAERKAVSTTHKTKSDKEKSEPEYPDYFDEILEKTLLKQIESPRAYIIIIVAYLDDLVTKLLKLGLIVPASNGGDDLFSEHGPLYNFGAKLLLAHRTGLISTEMLWSLQKLRKLRDKCAHSHLEVSFSHGYTKDITEEIFLRLEEDFQTLSTQGDEKFQKVVTSILLALWSSYSSFTPTVEPQLKEYIFR